MSDELMQPPQDVSQEAPQEAHPEMNADQSAAALSFATMLSEQQMPQAPMEEAPTDAPVSPETAPGEEKPPQGESDTNTRLDDLEARIFDELEDIKKMVKKDDKSEVEDIKKQLEEIINE